MHSSSPLVILNIYQIIVQKSIYYLRKHFGIFFKKYYITKKIKLTAINIRFILTLVTRIKGHPMSTVSQLTDICDILYDMENRLSSVSEEIKEVITDRISFRLQEIIDFAYWYNRLNIDMKDEFDINLGNIVYNNAIMDITVHGTRTKQELIEKLVKEHNLKDTDTVDYELMGILNMDLDMIIDEDLLVDVTSMMVDDVISELKKSFNPFQEFLSSIDENTLEDIYHNIIDVAYGTIGEHLDISHDYMKAIIHLSIETH